MPPRSAFNPNRQRHFIREWRKYRGYTQSKLAEIVGTSVGNISRIETGQQPYTQDLLEAAAEALMTDAASLIMRDPTQPDAIWTIWETAQPNQRQQIIDVAKALLKQVG